MCCPDGILSFICLCVCMWDFVRGGGEFVCLILFCWIVLFIAETIEFKYPNIILNFSISSFICLFLLCILCVYLMQ